MRRIMLIISFFIAVSCSYKDKKPFVEEDVFAKGADVSWITEMEEDGVVFYDYSGKKSECMALLKDLGMNAIRLRVWVNPKEKWCAKEDLLLKALRASSLGMRIMVDFHYSDWWADPGKQNKPATWKNLSFEDLKKAISVHTIEVLSLLKNNNITPEWIQIGNETSDGMLWDTGKASLNMKNYALLNNAGYYAAKTVFPDSKVLIHINNGWDNALYRWLLDGIMPYGAKYDMIGMSLYPEESNWQEYSALCISNINDIALRYNTEAIICEVGMDVSKPAICKSFLSGLINMSKTMTNKKCKGVFYWEPEGYAAWSNYHKAAFDDTGTPTIALEAFRD